MGHIAVGAQHVTLKRLNLATTGAHAIRVFGSYAVLESDDFTNNHANSAGACIGVGGSEGKPTGVVIRFNKIHDCGSNATTLNHGIYADASTDLLVTDNEFWMAGGYSIQLYPDTQNATVRNNVIDGSREYSTRGGIVIDGTALNDLIEFNVIANTTAAAIVAKTGSGHQAASNCFFNNAGGNVSGSTSVISQTGNVTTDPLFTDRTNHVYTLQAGTGCLPTVQYDAAAGLNASW
jgi:hypothetical protein